MAEFVTSASADDDVVVMMTDDPSALYRREFAAAVRLAVAMVDSPTVAEDMVQNAFAAVWVRWKRIDNHGAYLRVCVVNECRKELRRRQLTRRHIEVVEPAGLEPQARLLLDAIRRLSPRRRAVVVLRFYEDFSEAQIAAALRIRPGTVKATLHQALAQLREVIER
jgi:RNA polymerase sigma factor (sigma-70 family)